MRTTLEGLAATVPHGRIQGCHIAARINHPGLRAAYSLWMLENRCSPFSLPCTWRGTPTGTRCEVCPAPTVLGARPAAAHSCGVCTRRFGACRACCGCSSPERMIDTRGHLRPGTSAPHDLGTGPAASPVSQFSSRAGPMSEEGRLPAGRDTGSLGPLPAHGLRFGQDPRRWYPARAGHTKRAAWHQSGHSRARVRVVARQPAALGLLHGNRPRRTVLRPWRLARPHIAHWHCSR